LFPFLKYDFDIASKKASVSVIDYLFITAKFPSSKHSFEVCKQKKVTGRGPDLEKTVDGKPIRSLIHAVLPYFEYVF
jgi:hypothetical protein